jgi:STE24 endopeptidase
VATLSGYVWHIADCSSELGGVDRPGGTAVRAVSVPGWAGLSLGVLLLGLAVAGWWLVPWSRPAAPRADQLAALDELPAAVVARGRRLRAALRRPGYGSLGLGLVVVLVLGLTPAGAGLVDAVARPFGGHWLAAGVLGGLAVGLAGQLATLPLAGWRHAILASHGLSTQGWRGWAVDLLKGYVVAVVLAAVALAGFYTVTRLFPRWWWAVAAAGAAGLVALVAFGFPVLVEPVFNRFTPMAPGPLRTELVGLARRDQVPVREVLVADASRRTRAVNAYVSGLGPTRRIVVHDTLLAQAGPDEVVGVVAHELAHARHRDVATGTVLVALGAAATMVGVYLLGSWDGLVRAAGVSSIAEPRAVALLLAVLTVVGLASGPAQAVMSRRMEARADAHALALTRDPVTFTAIHARLAGVNHKDPDPPRWEQLLTGSHPSTVERIAAARAWSREAG